MTITPEQIEAARQLVGNVPHHLRAAFTGAGILREILADREARVLAGFSQCANPQPLLPGDASSHVYTHAVSASTAEVATLKFSLGLIEGSADYAEAVPVIAPMVAEVHRLEAEHLAQRLVAAEAAAARQAAIEAAKLEALAKVDARFAEPEPSAPAEPAKLFRGRQKLSSEEGEEPS